MEKFQISLAAARVNANLTQSDIAKAMGVSNVTVVNWEKGKTEIGTAQLAMYCSLCKIAPEHIFLPNRLT